MGGDFPHFEGILRKKEGGIGACGLLFENRPAKVDWRGRKLFPVNMDQKSIDWSRKKALVVKAASCVCKSPLDIRVLTVDCRIVLIHLRKIAPIHPCSKAAQMPAPTRPSLFHTKKPPGNPTAFRNTKLIQLSSPAPCRSGQPGQHRSWDRR